MPEIPKPDIEQEEIALPFGVFVNDEAVAGFTKRKLAEAFIDMICCTVSLGTRIELTDNLRVIGGFDEKGIEITPDPITDEDE
jgi:hypothetical protein